MTERARLQTKMAALVAWIVLLAGLVAPVRVSAADDVIWRSYDVTVEVQPSGVLRVTEDITVEFNGPFGQGHRTIPLDRIEDIQNVAVSVGDANGRVSPSRFVERRDFSGEPGTFTSYGEDGDLKIDYGFQPTGTATNVTDIRIVQLQYDAVGAIRVYDDEATPFQEIRWTAISSEVTEVGDIDRASVHIVLPEEVPADQLTFDPQPDEVTATSATWRRSHLSGGDALQVLVSFPPITAAIEPSWQPDAEALDRQKVREDRTLGLSFIVGPAIAVGFGLLMIFMRRSATRNAHVGMIADMLPEPPDDLSPGLAGALVDSSFDAKDAVAMLVDLDRRGVVEIHEREEGEEKKARKADDPERFGIVLRESIPSLPEWEQPFVKGLFGKGADPGKRVSFKALKSLREKHQGEVTKAIEQELFARGFFDEHPNASRWRWSKRTLAIVAVVAVVIAAMAFWTGSFPGSLIFLAALGAVLAGIALFVAHWSTVKSVAGQEETAKWKAFGRYLKQMQKEMPVSDRLALIDRYLPWAVALGFDSSWKSWMPNGDAPASRHRRRYGGVSSSTRNESPDGGGSFAAGGLQNASTSDLGAIQHGSASVFLMLNSAVSSFNAGSSSSSSGSSGGSASTGSSGGGGHSFS